MRYNILRHNAYHRLWSKAAGKADISGVPAQLDSGLKMKAAQWDPVRKSLYDHRFAITINESNHRLKARLS